MPTAAAAALLSDLLAALATSEAEFQINVAFDVLYPVSLSLDGDLIDPSTN
jgi:hypothetical protein